MLFEVLCVGHCFLLRCHCHHHQNLLGHVLLSNLWEQETSDLSSSPWDSRMDSESNITLGTFGSLMPNSSLSACNELFWTGWPNVEVFISATGWLKRALDLLRCSEMLSGPPSINVGWYTHTAVVGCLITNFLWRIAVVNNCWSCLRFPFPLPKSWCSARYAKKFSTSWQ